MKAGGRKGESVLQIKTRGGDDGAESRTEAGQDNRAGKADRAGRNRQAGRDDRGSRAGRTAGHGEAGRAGGQDTRQSNA